MCRRIFKEQTSETGDIPFYKIGTFGGEPDAFISTELFEEYKAKYPYPKKGDILISASGSIGRTVEFTGEKEYFQDSNIVWLNHDEHLDNTFLKCFYNVVRWSGLEGSTIKRLYNDNILKTEISVPSIEEQREIGAYFEQLDNLITLHQCKESAFSEWKDSGFLQKHKTTWEQRKLSEIYQNIGNAFVGTATPYYVEHGHFYLESNNIKDGQINHNSEIFINDEFYERQKDKWLHTGDMVMVQSGHVGHTAVIPEELDNSAAHALIMFRNPKVEIDPYFLNYQYQTNKSKKKIENITTGNTIKHILASDMQEFTVDTPKIEEQQHIARYFLELDHLITLHQCKCDYLIRLKYGVFSLLNKTDWEQRKLGEVAKYRNGKAHENCIDDNGKYIVVNSKFVSTDGEVRKFSNMQNEALFENEIAFVLSDVPNGRAIARTFLIEKSDKYTLNQRIAGITPLSETYPYYLHILMNRNPYFLAFDDGAKQTNLSVSDVMEFESYYPIYDEQKQIGEFFRNLDHLITLHQQKLKLLKQIKKAMVNCFFYRKIYRKK